MDDRDRRLAEAILERMPSSLILRTMQTARRHGMDWEAIEDMCNEAGSDTEPEGKRYYRRAMIAATALECGGANN